MAIAWSRISSKVIANPPSIEVACSRRCGNATDRSDVCIPQMVDRRKQEVLGARDAAVTLLSQTRGGRCRVRLADGHRTRSKRNEGAHRVSHTTTHQTTGQSQKASLPPSPGAPRA